ncbi:MAG: class I SAM-dependent methyltransferase [Anaerolineales bacterium]|nr:class I SAM-dependent methyltransferase [Anaerolineales bacterium]
MTTDPNSLQKKYDQYYGHEAAGLDGSAGEIRVEPVQLMGWPNDRKQALVKLARPGGRLLEIGCGKGDVLAALAGQYDEIVGTELSSVRAGRTQVALSHLPHCHIVNEPLETMADYSFDTPFDCIIWADVIEHIVDVIGAMHLLAKLSKPGTQLVTVTPNVGFLPQRLNVLRGRAPNTAVPGYPNEGFTKDPNQTRLLDHGHLHYFTFRQVEMLYKIGGFRPEQRLGVGARFYRLRNWWPTLLSGLVCVSGTYQG